jgi:hypothetical protein
VSWSGVAFWSKLGAMSAVRAVAVAIFAALLVLVAPAAAGPPGSWTRLPGTVVNFAEPGLARTSDGVLHVVYTRKNGTKAELAHASVSPAGKVGTAAVALGGWASMSHPDLLRMPDGSLRVFFGGIRTTSPGETNNALNTATAPASGAKWTLQSGKAAQSTYAYATTSAGASLAKNGTPISSWAGTPGLGFHYGVDPADPDHTIPQSGCCLYNPDIGVDSASGQAWIGFASNESARPGMYANAIGPGGPEGSRKLAPGSVNGKNFLQPLTRTPITGRIGAGGVFLVYGQGYPTSKSIALWPVDRSQPQLIVKADGMRHANVAAAPEGRLWLMWDRNAKVYATRTNHAATKVGPVSALKPPGSGSVYELDGDGSAGPLDVIANDGQGLWHQQVRPRLQLVATSKKSGAGRVITFRVLDAGDPVGGATVKVGGRSFKTRATGVATLRQASAKAVSASASKAGYVSASLKVR